MHMYVAVVDNDSDVLSVTFAMTSIKRLFSPCLSAKLGHKSHAVKGHCARHECCAGGGYRVRQGSYGRLCQRRQYVLEEIVQEEEVA